MTFAPQIILNHSKNIGSEKLIKILAEYFQAAGAYGVIAGQVVDIESEKLAQSHSLDIEDEQLPEILNYIHTHKTADLFKLALRSGAIIAGATDIQLEEITTFGQKLGIAFQIADDILDEISTFEEMGKTLGKDKNSEKLTYVTLYGLDASKCKVSCLLKDCYDIMNRYEINSEIFTEIIEGIKKRVGI